MPDRRTTRSTKPTAAVAAQDAAIIASTTFATPQPSKPAPKPKAKAKASKRAADDSDEEFGKKGPAKKKTKKELKDDAQVVDAANDSDAEDVDDKNMVTVLKRGAAPVDPTCGLVGT